MALTQLYTTPTATFNTLRLIARTSPTTLRRALSTLPQNSHIVRLSVECPPPRTSLTNRSVRSRGQHFLTKAIHLLPPRQLPSDSFLSSRHQPRESTDAGISDGEPRIPRHCAMGNQRPRGKRSRCQGASRNVRLSIRLSIG